MGARKAAPPRTVCKNLCGEQIELRLAATKHHGEVWVHRPGGVEMCGTRAQPATVEPCERGCPPDARTTVGDVLVHGHNGDCVGGEPRRYVWLDGGWLMTGTLADYGEAFQAAYSGTVPPQTLGRELRTWDTAYWVRSERLAGGPDEDGYCQVRLSVPGEEVTVQVWEQ